MTPAQERGKAYLRAFGGQVQEADSGIQPLRILPQRTEGHEPENL